jgi:hypothetical protein
MDSSGGLIRRLKANRHARELADQDQGFDYGPNQSSDSRVLPSKRRARPSIANRSGPAFERKGALSANEGNTPGALLLIQNGPGGRYGFGKALVPGR